MSQPDPTPPSPDDIDALLEGCLRIHPDDLVAFAQDFFAAMDAMRGTSAEPDAPPAA